MFAAPVLAGDTHPTLHFIEDQQNVVFIADRAQSLQKLAPKMIVATLALYWFDDNRGDIRAFRGNYISDLLLCYLFFFDHPSDAFLWRHREIEAWTGHARPWKFSKIGNLARVRVREAHRVARAPVECAFEMNNLSTALTF